MLAITLATAQQVSERRPSDVIDLRKIAERDLNLNPLKATALTQRAGVWAILMAPPPAR